MFVPQRRFVSLLALALLTLAACDDGHDHDHDGHSSMIMFMGQLDATPATDHDHTLTVTLTMMSDSSPITGATLVAEEPWMDAHGHGSGTTPNTITEVGEGVYTLSPVKFIMPGEWKIKVHATKGDMHEHHDFLFTVE